MNRSAFRKSTWVYGAVLAAGFTPSLVATAFAPKEWHEVFGLIGKSHERQTGDAVREVVQQLYKSPTVGRTTERAIDEIAEADADIDLGEHKEDGRYHFDGELFERAQATMTTAVDDIVYGLKNNRVEGARWKLGGALHTLQDFYSHSNWIERQNTQPHPQVGRGIRIESTASLHENTCIDCIKQAPSCPDCSRDLTTERLTTGYYGGQTDNSRPEGVAKCSHGGTKDSTATGGDEDNPTSGLNKDTKFCELSPHASLHATAASVGTAATKQFLLDLKGKVSETEFMQLLGIGPSVATVLDTSGSMESVWKDLADHMEKLRQGWGRLRGQEARHSLQRDLRGPLPFPAWARSHARRCSDQAALVGRETPRREVALVGRSTAQDTFCKEAHEVGDVRRAASRYDAGRLCAHGDATPALRAPT